MKNKPVDYMLPSGIHRLRIKDRTHQNGRPTFTNMHRQLIKAMRYA